MKLLQKCKLSIIDITMRTVLIVITIAFAASIEYALYTYAIDTKELNHAYTAMTNGNYTWAMEQFQYILDTQESRGYLFESNKVTRKAREGLDTASTLYHYNSALEYYADENWEEAIYHFGQVIDYRDSLALLHKCLDGYAMTYYIEDAPG